MKAAFQTYLPHDEVFVSQQNSSFDSRYKFSAKEKDDATQYSYFGARYLDTDLSVWLNVDPLADQRSWVSPYNYCQNNPIGRVDPTGALDGWVEGEDGKVVWDKNINSQAEADDAGVKYHGQTITAVNDYGMTAYGDEEGKLHIGVMLNPAEIVGQKSKDNSPYETASTASNTSGSSSNTAQTVNTVATVGGLITNAAQQIAKTPTIGYNIAYNNTLLKGVSYLKPIGYWATGASFVSDIYMSSTNQQSWTETGANTVVTGVAIGVGGWTGLVIQANYQASKLYMKTLMEHPDWAPYPSNGFRH